MSDDVSIAIGAKDTASAAIDRVAAKVGSLSSVAAAGGPGFLAIASAVATAAASYVAIGSAISALAQSSEEIDALSDKARALGETVGDIQAFQFAMNEAGNLDASTSLAALTKIQRIVGDIAIGGDDAVFKKLNLDAKALSLKGPLDQFNAIREALAKIENNSERAALAQKLLGKSASELLPALTASSESFADSAKYAKEVGAVTSNEGAQGIAKMNDAVGRVSLAMKGLANTTLEQLAPAIEIVAVAIARWGPPVVKFARVYVRSAIDQVAFLADGVVDVGKAVGFLDADTKTFAQSIAIARLETTKLAEEMEAARRKANALSLVPKATEPDKIGDKAVADTIALLERQYDVAQLGEDAVKEQEQLALARNDAERERITLLQEQLFAQKQLNEAAEEKGKKDEELAKKKEAEARKTGPGALRAVESRFLTRGPANDTAKQLLEEAKAQKELQRQANLKLDNIYAEAKRKGMRLEVVQ